MNKILSVIAVVLISLSAFGQKNTNRCGTESAMENFYLNTPEKKAAFSKRLSNFNEFAAKHRARKNQNPIIIPTVIHVFHYNGASNISDQQVLDGLNQINEDIQRMNSDTGDTRSIFKPYAGALDLEFRLAKKDPSGQCTNGIVRVNDPSSSGFEGSDALISKWDNQNTPGQNQYFNMWIVGGIQNFTGGNGIILGYAYYPGGTTINGQFNDPNNNNPFYGLVNRSDAWGKIGSNISYSGRTPTHEVGHALSLPHTFNRGCGSDCSTTGDYICDTPPARDPTYGCSQILNSCSNDLQGPSPYSSDMKNQIENYMSYDDCQNMFSQGQANRMSAAIAYHSKLATLTSASNLIATGTDDAYYFSAPDCTPIADFWVEQNTNCENNIFEFKNFAYNDFKDSTWTYNWSFPGGTPATSNAESPTVTYSQSGQYNVSLTVTNSQGTSLTETKNNYVNVVSGSGSFIGPIKTFFTEPSFPVFQSDPSLSWEIVNQNNSVNTWERTTNAFFSGPASVYLNNYNIQGSGKVNSLLTPAADLTQMNQAYLNFQLAYAQKNNQNEYLIINYSEDCGASWNLLRVEQSLRLKSVPNLVNSEFIPSGPSEWKNYTLNISNLAGRDNIIFKLDFKSFGGNNIFIDDFEISESPLTNLEKNIQPQSTFHIYPNPGKGLITLELDNFDSDKNIDLRIVNSLGQTLETFQLETGRIKKEIDMSHLGNGLYFIQSVSDKSIIKKLIIE